MEKISGIDVQEHEKSKRILNIRLNDEIIEKLIFPFNKFDLTALELKPFTRFTIAKSLDDFCLLYTTPSPRDISGSRMPSSA